MGTLHYRSCCWLKCCQITNICDIFSFFKTLIITTKFHSSMGYTKWINLMQVQKIASYIPWYYSNIWSVHQIQSAFMNTWLMLITLMWMISQICYRFIYKCVKHNITMGFSTSTYLKMKPEIYTVINLVVNDYHSLLTIKISLKSHLGLFNFSSFIL